MRRLILFLAISACALSAQTKKIIVMGSNPATIKGDERHAGVEGARDVVAEPVMGKGYLEIKIDREKAARYGVRVGDIQDTIEVALGGRMVTQTVEGRDRFPACDVASSSPHGWIPPSRG